jgi:hypothetical protein
MFTILEMILMILGAGGLAALGLKPLKESAEYRFSKKGKLFKGLAYIGIAAISLITWTFWPLLIGLPAAFLIEKKSNDQKLLN